MLKETNFKNNNNNNNKRKTEIEKELWNRLSELNKEFKDIREHKKKQTKKTLKKKQHLRCNY